VIGAGLLEFIHGNRGLPEKDVAGNGAIVSEFSMEIKPTGNISDA